MTPSSWTVLQIGAREHYAVARALHRQGRLHELLTDCWVPPRSALAQLPRNRRVSGRYHPDLATARVGAPSLSSVLFELRGRLPGSPSGWSRTMARNAWFQRWACRHLSGVQQSAQALFAYSYAARSVFRLASDRGWFTVLGQIDPGPPEERIVAEEHRRYPEIVSSWQPAPPSYWQAWREELHLADRIVVNSPWSLRCLMAEGVPETKLRLIPLVYEPEGDQSGHRRSAAPHHITSTHYQVLFLGTIGLRKGVGRLLEAMQILEGLPIQLTLAGPSELDADAWAGRSNVRWIGPQPRSAVSGLYQESHVMILPTLSDGFALTQLEALAHGCPVIVSRHCGNVVRHGVNGWILEDLEPSTLAACIREAAQSAASLPRPLVCPRFGLDHLASDLTTVQARI